MAYNYRIHRTFVPYSQLSLKPSGQHATENPNCRKCVDTFDRLDDPYKNPLSTPGDFIMQAFTIFLVSGQNSYIPHPTLFIFFSI